MVCILCNDSTLCTKQPTWLSLEPLLPSPWQTPAMVLVWLASLQFMHHIFTQCPRFMRLHDNSFQSLHHSVTIFLESFQSGFSCHPHLHFFLDSIFTENVIWLTSALLYYLGLIPPLLEFLDDTELGHLTPLQQKWLDSRLVSDCHAVSICLSGWIWGVVHCSFSPYCSSTTTSQKPYIFHLSYPVLYHLPLHQSRLHIPLSNCFFSPFLY